MSRGSGARCGWCSRCTSSQFAVIALACHGRLAAARPGVEHLTEFYFWLAVGGFFGGLFNSIVATAVFVTTAEYPITLALACVTRVRHVDLGAVRGKWAAWTVPVAAGLLVLLAGPAVRWAGLPPGFLLIYLAAPALLCYSVSRRPALFALGVALMLGAGAVRTGSGRSLLENRTFYGSYRVAVDPSGRYHELFSGSTLHGRQLVDAGGPLEPLAYYHREGPVGDVFRARRRAGPLRVAVVGLGVGALAAYAAPDRQLDVLRNRSRRSSASRATGDGSRIWPAPRCRVPSCSATAAFR